MKRALAVAVVVFLVVLTVIRHESRTSYFLAIDDSEVVIEKTLLKRSNRGFESAIIEAIEARPGHPDHLLAVGLYSFLSLDGGQSWKPLIRDHDDRRVNWKALRWTEDGHIEDQVQHSVYRSTDLGETWSEEISDEDRGFESSEPRHEAGVEGLPFPGRVTQLESGERFAATAAGVFYRASEDGPWIRRNRGITVPTVRRLAAKGKVVLAVDAAAQLWRSEDFGRSWSRYELFDIQLGAFLRGADDTPFAITRDNHVLLLEPAGPRDVGPPSAMLERDPRGIPTTGPEEICGVRALGDGALLLLLSPMCSMSRNTFPYGEEQLMEFHEQYGRVLRRSSNGEWSRLDYQHPFFEDPRSAGGCELSVAGTFDAQVGRAGESVRFALDVPHPFVGLVDQAGWLDAHTHFLFGESGVQVGVVDESCRPEHPNRAWTWASWRDEGAYFYFGASLNRDEAVLRAAGDWVEILLPSDEGLWRGRFPKAPGITPKAVLNFMVFNVYYVWALGLALLGLYLFRRRAEVM